MYRALYAFTNNDPSVLSCAAGDRFTILDTNDENWWLAQNGRGEVGYIPASYLAADESGVAEVLLSIDRAIDVIQKQLHAQTDAPSKKALEDKLKQLQNHRQKVVSEQQQAVSAPTKRRAPRAPSTSSDVEQQFPTQTQAAAAAATSKKKESFASSHDASSSFSPVPAPVGISTRKMSPVEVDQQTTSSDTGISSSESSSDAVAMIQQQSSIPPGLGMEIVEVMRRNTGLSHSKSKVAVMSVLNFLRDRVPSIQSVINAVIEGVDHVDNYDCNERESDDAVQLRQILQQLVMAKDDSQQRSWFLHEDEPTICQHLHDVISILEGANPSTSRAVLASDGYAACHSLALYYQMETRLAIRLLLLKTFCAMCTLEEKVVSELLNSVLPLELARDIQTDVTDVQKMAYSVLVLSMLFSTGEAIPLQYYEHLNEKFIEFVLANIEEPPAVDETEMLPDIFVKLVLSFNLHFELPSENLVMKVLAERGTAKTFTEKLLLLFNREDDPTRTFDYQSQRVNSVLKFLSDMYSCRQTANLLYTNDAKVLIDIIVRQLSDLSAGNQMRTEYLSLIHLLLTNSDYADHLHRQLELSQCFVRIAHEETDSVDIDNDIVKQIWKQFPQLFYDTS